MINTYSSCCENDGVWFIMKISSVTANAEYSLTVCFENHHTVIIDMRQKLQTARFSSLTDWNQFGAVQTDGRAILWPNGTSISTSEILEILGK